MSMECPTLAPMILKDVIQFSEYDEENLPKIGEEKDAFLKTITTLEDLIKNEERIYASYRNQLDSQEKKQEMPASVHERSPPDLSLTQCGTARKRFLFLDSLAGFSYDANL